MPSIIPVFYTIDDEYAELAVVSISSLIAHANPAYQYNIHIVYQELTSAHIARLQSLSRPGFNVILDKLDETFAFITDRSDVKSNNFIWPIAVYFRLFIPDAFPQYNRGIYLDSDTVVLGDISELFFTDLAGKAIGACHDFSIAGIPDFITYIEQGDGVPFGDYVNSGVLLIDMKKMRDLVFREHFIRIFTQFNPQTVAPDQDYLNTMLHGNITQLDRSWDAMPTSDMEPLPDPKIVHYNLFFKPWRSAVDYEDIFWSAAAAAGLEDYFRTLRADFSEQDAANDRAGLEMLLFTARKITAEDTGLGAVFRSGNAKVLS